MQKNLQRKFKLNYSKEVVDIVQFGSSVLEESNPNDIDIAVIFNKIPLKQQLEEAQGIKKQLEREFDLPIHIKSYDFYSFFDKGNFAKEGILFYGISLINREYFSEKLGLKPKIHISYSLNNLEKKDKVRFNYMLNGKKGNYGLLREFQGKLLNPGLIEISPKFENKFTKAISSITKHFTIKKFFELE